jgi:CHAD domain-containing protein
MPGNHPILNYWRAELKIFDKNLLSLRKQLTADAIHDLRVSIKKLRSCLKLYLHLADRTYEKKIFVDTSDLFSVLGKHRNIEIGKNLLKSLVEEDAALLHSMLVYLQLLQDQAGEYCKQFLDKFERKELDELTNELETDLENYNGEEMVDATHHFLLSSMEEAKDELKHFKERSHLIRKRLKDIYYQATIFDDEILFSKPQLKTIHKILDHLGNIQDHEVVILNLKSFRKLVLSKTMKEYSAIKEIENSAEKKQDNLLEKASDLTKELMDTAL